MLTKIIIIENLKALHCYNNQIYETTIIMCAVCMHAHSSWPRKLTVTAYRVIRVRAEYITSPEIVTDTIFQDDCVASSLFKTR
jgi:hypothetical protein